MVQNKAVIICPDVIILILEVVRIITLWERFCMTGKVEDYLEYKLSSADEKEKGSVHYASDVEGNCST